eukprot:1577100-Pleurochrysis_carterae.AAC.1
MVQLGTHQGHSQVSERRCPTGAVIEFTIALLVPDLDVNLAFVEQAMVHNKVEVRFGEHLNMVFHKHNKSIPLDAGYGLRVRPLNSTEF